jgi:hypothetical protein
MGAAGAIKKEPRMEMQGVLLTSETTILNVCPERVEYLLRDYN